VVPPPDRDASDESLAEAAQDGQVRALDLLLDRHQGKVLRVLRYLGVPHDDREDVAQEVFIRVFRHLGSFRRGQPFGAWLYRMTVNAAHDFRSKRVRTSRDEAPWSEHLDRPADEPGPGDSLQRQELQKALLAALELLTARERAVFVLREVEGLRTAEVARTLGITGITVRRHLALARKRLRGALGERIEKNSISIDRIAPGESSQ